MKFIFGNANKKLQKLMRTEDDNEEEVKGIVINSRVFSNSMFSSYQHAYILCFNQLFVIEETDMEKLIICSKTNFLPRAGTRANKQT